MTAQDKILDGKLVANTIRQQVAARVEFLKVRGVLPRLTVILVGDDAASRVYVGRKEKMCKKLGMTTSRTIYLPARTEEAELLALIDKLNVDPDNHGILVQMPLPNQINPEKVIRHIRPEKDVDCFHPYNVGLLVSGQPYVLPCTPAGIIEILKYYNISTQGKHAVVIGRSNIVGKPMANLLVQKNAHANATVTIAHSRTKNIEQISRQADILIAAMGYPRFVKSDMIREGAVIIDVGMNRIDADNEKGYELTGDVDFKDVYDKAGYITPVPGGVGPMTIAMLMQNTVTAAAWQNDIELD